jgi:hypothetical protein
MGPAGGAGTALPIPPILFQPGSALLGDVHDRGRRPRKDRAGMRAGMSWFLLRLGPVS